MEYRVWGYGSVKRTGAGIDLQQVVACTHKPGVDGRAGAIDMLANSHNSALQDVPILEARA